MIAFCVVFAFAVAYIAYRGVTGTTGVNIAINIIQISALLVFRDRHRLSRQASRTGGGYTLIPTAPHFRGAGQR